jgi:hypothetical protein
VKLIKIIPNAIGCLKSYFHEHSKQEAEVKLFKFPEELAVSFSQEKPTIDIKSFPPHFLVI